tara:strand:- start:602 stop:826 length:225 start_codon:yes stop_codon:yes gene_type:complete
MTLTVAKAMLRLWRAAKMSSPTAKLVKMKNLSALTKKHGGTSQAIKQAKRTLNRDSGLRELERTKSMIAKANRK